MFPDHPPEAKHHPAIAAARAVVVGMMNLAQWWPIIALGAVVVTGKVIVAWLAIRKTDTKDVPKTVTALAELFRWWRLH